MRNAHLTLDVNVIMIGLGMSNLACQDCHKGLLDAFTNTVFLAIDNGGHLRQLYRDKLGSASIGTIWLANLAKKDRIVPFPFGKLAKGTKVKLDKAHFHWDDNKYVRLAMSTPCKRLVTEDADFSDKIKKILVDCEGVVVSNSQDMHDCICASNMESAHPGANQNSNSQSTP